MFASPMPLRRLPQFAALMFTLVSVVQGCAPPENPFVPKPHYDDDTGLTGVPTEAGNMEGVWALAVNVGTRVEVPILGFRNSGSLGIRLITRTWDAGNQRYHDVARWCHYEIFEVEGSQTRIRDGALSTVEDLEYDVFVDHPAGSMGTTEIANNWGWHDMPDPAGSPVPSHRNYQNSPYRDWVYDQDQDGHVGFTLLFSGLFNAEAYFISAAVYRLDGTVTSPDRVSGLLRHTRSHQNTLDATNSALVGEGKTRLDDDPKARWFDLQRLPPGSDCQQANDLLNAGTIGRRPF